MDPSIRSKTALEIAAEKRKAQTARSEHQMIRAMAKALSETDYTRDSDVRKIKPRDARYAVGKGIKALVFAGDRSFASEFINESGGLGSDDAMFEALADFMIEPSREAADRFMEVAALRSRWYGDTWLRRALDTLDSASEIQRDLENDIAIDERKSA